MGNLSPVGKIKVTQHVKDDKTVYLPLKGTYMACKQCGRIGGAIHLEEEKKDREGNVVKNEKGEVQKVVVRHFATLRKDGDGYLCQCCR